MAKLRTVWTDRAKAQLKQIHDYLKYEKKTPQGAANVKRDLIEASKGVAYSGQYQKDDINPSYRRIVVRHYKLVYKEDKGKIIILRVFDTLQNPDRLLKGNE
ncbi:type II toxin-antitoxin system RelE/ParE family toxin [Arenibacter sp. GZD96]|uniref:type II toxin-antitoxin system RelE/ParE family toxin n=1 Tax=Aurantibrevibacter litoralis TaxID=3106030 RepID=UPI002AFE3C2B|nr:type II toxin-antitoxin system RelE/ParE family toxin [Arenibacter sp. GZD-96]MEA1786097.1 type II toxin-antitoxin system RelE/ParE family toxin [Arenibacter sp. GZD-96]